ncbi:YbaB/EbfC family nucleoid-associated protein [Nocardia xishanensis]|uniref:YbaB/EbfC family nucleoid-associated protein n=1 Tax=Nocardia xishanensis TaxID=238964 RepID=A0ABW7XAD3_9NOCA
MDDNFAGAVNEFQATVAELTRVQAECAQLVATGWAQRRRVRVTVNAEGIAIEIKFGAGIEQLSYDEIAEAVTEASRQAVREIAARTSELMGAVAADTGPPPQLDGLRDLVGALRDLLR